MGFGVVIKDPMGLLAQWGDEADREFIARFPEHIGMDYAESPRDAFRHAYVSGKIAQSLNFTNGKDPVFQALATAPSNFLGLALESMSMLNPDLPRSSIIMDLFNNLVGSLAGVSTNTTEELAADIELLIRTNGLITGHDDPRLSLWQNIENFGKGLGDLLYDFLHPGEQSDLWVVRGRFGFLIPQEFNDLIHQGYTTSSPIVMDLDGDGIETINVEDSTVQYDLDADGRYNKTGWLSGDDGFLVLDRDYNGVIDTGREMFGNNTVDYYPVPPSPGSFSPRLASWELCRDGYWALNQEDTNRDGVLNHLDKNWGSLQIWRDINQDGVSQADELFSLLELGISSINVEHEYAYDQQNGNTLYGSGAYIDTNGNSHYLTDAWFEQDNFISGYTDTIEIPEDMRGLPSMGGSGAVRELLQAA